MRRMPGFVRESYEREAFIREVRGADWSGHVVTTRSKAEALDTGCGHGETADGKAPGASSDAVASDAAAQCPKKRQVAREESGKPFQKAQDTQSHAEAQNASEGPENPCEKPDGGARPEEPHAKDPMLLHALELTPQELGELGESIAADCLEELGYQIIERNWRNAAGEADLVCRDGSDHVLVEVKTRLASPHAHVVLLPELAVDLRKQRIYRRMAELYLSELDEPAPVRFDVVAVTVRRGHRPLVRHYVGAFECDA